MSTTAISKPVQDFASVGQREMTEPITLGKNEVYSWEGGRDGLVIEAREGKVWLTQTGDGRDVILSRGDRFHVRRSGRVVAQGLGSLARIVAQ